MEINLGKRAFEIPGSCPATGSPRKSTLKRQLREHGVEGFLTSKKFSKFAGCISAELKEAASRED